MSVSVSLPLLNSRISTKALIIRVSSEEWPLFAREIYSRVVRRLFSNKELGIEVNITENLPLAETLGKHYLGIWGSAK
jgi:hypothetical protein